VELLNTGFTGNENDSEKYFSGIRYSITPTLHYSIRKLGKYLNERLSTTDARIQHFRK
jgi:hypothetical protein